MKLSLLALLLVGLTGVAHAGIYPSTPVGDTVWKVGSKVTIEWSDNEQSPPLQKMAPFEVALYTGSDMQQAKLAVIATGVTRNTTSLEFTVPNVTPFGKIYFLRFTVPKPGASEPYLFWTTRFTITDTDNTQPSPSDAGVGSLASPTSSAQSSASATAQSSGTLTVSSQSSATLESQTSSIVATPVATESLDFHPSLTQNIRDAQSTKQATKSDGNRVGVALWILVPVIGFRNF